MSSFAVLLVAAALHIGSMSIMSFKMEWNLQSITNFKFDRLGFVLLLGAIQFNMITSHLAHNDGVEWYSALSAYASTSGSMTSPLPGFRLYNLTDKIKALDPAGWFTRWLSAKDVGYVGTTIRVSRKVDTTSSLSTTGLVPMLVGVLLVTYHFSIAMLRRDMFGFIHASCTSIALLTSALNLYLLRSDLDKMASEFLPLRTIQDGSYGPHEMCKVWLTMPNGNSVHIEAPRGLVRCLLTTPKPASLMVRSIIRYICLVALTGQVLTLGLASLPYQTVSIFTTGYACLSKKEPSNDIGNMLEININQNMGDLSHMGVYAVMDMDTDEEESMCLWGLMPHESNRGWWEAYAKVKAGKTAQ